MRKLITAWLLLLSLTAQAGLPPTTLKGQSEASAKAKFSFQTPFSQISDLGGVTGLFETGNQNILKNPGFEDTSASVGWTASGGATATANSTALGTGAKGYDWDSNSAAQTLLSTAITIPAGLMGKNGAASCAIKTPSGGATHLLQAYDGTNILSSTTITSSTSTFARTSVNFIFPTSGSVSLRIISVASNEPEIYVDDCYLGLADGFNVSQISQAVFYGSIEWAGAASCQWTAASGGSSAFADFPADTDCPAPTVTGGLTAPGTKLFNIVMNNAPPGVYFFVARGGFDPNGTGSLWRWSDGTTTQVAGAINNNGTINTQAGFNGQYTYTTAGDRTIKLQAASTGGAGSIFITNTNTATAAHIDVFRYPTTTEQAYRPDLNPLLWSGFHTATCSWSVTNTAYTDPSDDGTCTLTERVNTNAGTVVTSGAAKPGITLTLPIAGRYWVCAQPKLRNNTSSSATAVKLWDGTTTIAEAEIEYPANNAYNETLPLCGVYSATSAGSKTFSIQIKANGSSTGTIEARSAASSVEWSVASLNQSAAAPILVGSVTSNSTGAQRVENAILSCGASSAITSQSGSWISAIGNISSGSCVVTIATGMFSATPSCFITGSYTGTTQAERVTANVASATSVTISGSSMSSGSATVSAYTGPTTYNFACIGPK
jgi:hypothetical protein